MSKYDPNQLNEDVRNASSAAERGASKFKLFLRATITISVHSLFNLAHPFR